MKAEELVESGFVSADINEPLSKLIGRMEKENAGEAFIFDAGKLAGIFDHERLLRSKINVDELKVGNFQKKVPYVRKDASLFDLAAKFSDADSHILPVFDDDQFIGGVHVRNLLLNGSGLGIDSISMDKAKSHVSPLLESDSISTVLSYMYNNKLREILVRDSSDKVVGLVKHRDLMFNYYKQSSTKVEKEKAGMAYKKGSLELKELPVSNFMLDYETSLFKDVPDIQNLLNAMARNSSTSVFFEQDSNYYVISAVEILKGIVKSRVEYPDNIHFMGLEDMGLDEFTKAKVHNIASRQGEKLNYYINGEFELFFHFKKYKKEGTKNKFSVNVRVNSPKSKAISHRAYDWDAITATRKAIESILNQLKKDGKKD